jgi:sporulation integral membrane protein YlbJ
MSVATYKYKLIKGFILLFFILMFIFPYASYQGACSGLLLWFLNVLPTLLPFVIVSNLMIKLNIAGQISRILHPVLGRLFRLSRDGCYPILLGFLSGIPMGAKSSADLVNEKRISRKEGSFLLSMCNNASPVFIMNYIAVNQLKLPRIRLPLFVIIYSSAIISALIFRFIMKRSRRFEYNAASGDKVLSSAQNKGYRSVRFTFDLLDSSIMNGFEVVTKIGGYIILFSILAQIVSDTVPAMGLLKASFMGVLEITTGINQICKIKAALDIKIVLAAVLTSFGGLSGMAQTKSVLGDSGLSIKSYFAVKVFNAFVTFLLTLIYVTVIMG